MFADQEKDVAAGVQLAVNTEEPPTAIEAGEAIKLHTGAAIAFTVTDALADGLVPAALLAMTE